MPFSRIDDPLSENGGLPIDLMSKGTLETASGELETAKETHDA
jgi:hypothetical protein